MKHLPIVIACLVCAFTFIPPRPPAVTGPVATALRSAPSSDREYLAALHKALRDVVVRDNGQRISTTRVWRSVYQDALRLAVGGTALKGKYPGLDVAVEEVLAKHYPLDEVAMGPDVVKQIADALADVEEQCRTN